MVEWCGWWNGVGVFRCVSWSFGSVGFFFECWFVMYHGGCCRGFRSHFECSCGVKCCGLKRMRSVVRRVEKQLKTPKKISKPFQSFDFSVLVPLEFKVQKYFEKMFISFF